MVQFRALDVRSVQCGELPLSIHTPPMRLLLVMVVCVVFGAGCARDHDADHPTEPLTLPVTTPFHTDTTVEREFVCQIHAIQHIELRALERGYLQNILVDEGQTIRKGQLMFQLLPTVYEAEFEKAQAEVRLADIEYRNTKSLADGGVVSASELAMVHARLQRAQAEASLAKAHLSFTRIHAPFTGIMDRLHVRNGSLLEEGEMLATLSDNSQMWVYFNVPEAQYLNLMQRKASGTDIPVHLKMANNTLFDQQGRVTTIEADFNNETGNIAFRATFPNPKGLLRHGETGSILLRDSLHNVLLIPQKATFEILDKKYVFVVDANNVVHSRPITIAAELPHLYAVAGGLGPTDRILLEGLRKVRDRDTIRVHMMDPEKTVRSLGLTAE
ncbi:MAG: efflux RND transporter periplasmic adaptor subunit [Candidatus Kapabacteria bacterium]|nr:efflux RND transporter periplasmic adaptor subunit [Candidatus Kapabacteria bacterium]